MNKLRNINLLLLIASMALSVMAQTYDQRARDLVRQMTLDEKIQQLHGIRDDEKGIYRYVPPVPRLGIPALQITNGPAGAGPGSTRAPRPQVPATALPSPIALAATWDRSLARIYGVIAGSESRAIGSGLLEAPTINIARLPQNGRTFEGYGEDPYLVGELSVNNILGIQSEGVIANVKHYIANNQEAERFTIDEIIDERTMREIYLPAFEASIKRGNSASVMCAYPKINGTFNCENGLLLNDILKKEWGFHGFVTSDFGAVHSSEPSAVAGLDLEMPTGEFFGDKLKAAVESGKIPVSVIDDKLIRRYRTMMELGVFDNPPKSQPIPARENGAKARQIAEQGMVLLKNTGNLLPLSAARQKTIALIGPLAAKAVTGGGGSSHVVPLYTVDPQEGLRNVAGPKVDVRFNDGSDLAAAAALAKSSDIAIVMVGMIDTEGRDHTIVLGDDANKLVETVAAANPKTVVVLKTGSAVLMSWIDKVPAILEAWYPGEEDGTAVADVLFGLTNPSGRLPITFPRSLAELPTNTPEQYPGVDGVARYSEGVFVGYRHYDAKNIEPLFPFGFGLSYSTFEYQNLKIHPGNGKHPQYRIEFDVKNTGKLPGAEVVQLYISQPGVAISQPPKQLRGFEKVMLKPGESRHIRFELDSNALAYWSVQDHGWKVEPGTYKVLVGSSSRLIRFQGSINVVP